MKTVLEMVTKIPQSQQLSLKMIERDSRVIIKVITDDQYEKYKAGKLKWKLVEE